MYRNLLFIRNIAACAVFCFSVAAFAGAFYPVRFFNLQGVPLLAQSVSLFIGTAIIALVLLTLLFGRVYCSVLCPLGLFQEAVRLFVRKPLSLHVNRAFKYILAVFVFGSLLGGTAFFARLLDPYALFGAAFSGAAWGLCVLGAISILTVLKGRFFCTDICPLGALLGFLSKYAVFQIFIEARKCRTCGKCARICPGGCIDYQNCTVQNDLCIRCLKCLKVCPFQAMRYGKKRVPAAGFNLKRRQFLIGVAALAAFAAAYKGGLIFVQKTANKFKNVLVPPGAGSAAEFVNRCLNCNLCVQNCPMKVLKKATLDYPAVHTGYTNSFCSYTCRKCSQICPSGALKRLSLSEKQRTKIGTAHITAELCVNCGLCVMECPREAIKQEKTAPVVQTQKCIGCGACKVVCPVQAILIEGVEKQVLLPTAK